MLVSIVGSLADGFFSITTDFVRLGGELIIALCEGLASNAGEIVTTIANGIVELVDTIATYMPLVISAVIEVVLAVADAIIKAIPTLIAAIPVIINSLIEGIEAIITGLITALPQLILGLIQLVLGIVEHLPEIIMGLVEALPQIIEAVINGLMDALPQLIEGLILLNVELVKHLPEIILALIEAIPKIVVSIVEAFGACIGSIVDVGINLVKGLWEGICNAASWLWDQITGWLGSIWDGILGFFGIHSPSTKMRDIVGKNIVHGLADGITAEGDVAVDAMLGIAEDIANVEFKTGEVDFDELSDKITQAVDAEVTATARDISSTAIPASAYGSSDDNDSSGNDDDSDQPGGMIETNIYIDGKKTARAITPYVAKELDWEDK